MDEIDSLTVIQRLLEVTPQHVGLTPAEVGLVPVLLLLLLLLLLLSRTCSRSPG